SGPWPQDRIPPRTIPGSALAKKCAGWIVPGPVRNVWVMGNWFLFSRTNLDRPGRGSPASGRHRPWLGSGISGWRSLPWHACVHLLCLALGASEGIPWGLFAQPVRDRLCLSFVAHGESGLLDAADDGVRATGGVRRIFDLFPGALSNPPEGNGRRIL